MIRLPVEASLRATHGALLVALIGLCACHQTPPPATAAPAASSAPAAGQTVPVTPNPPSAPPAPSVPASPPPSTTTPLAAAPGPKAASKPAAVKPTVSATAVAGAKPPVHTPDASKPAASSRPAVQPAAASLDLTSLEQRLRDTKAIGVFTKLSLKNQVDDLLDEVRAYHRSPSQSAQPALRQQFEGLILKVLSSLQGGDPQLADTIAASRETLWGILMDPDKFSKI